MKTESVPNLSSTCEACGEPFACGVEACGCWCAEVKLSERVLESLRQRYSGCLCRACLERFAAADGLREA